MDDVTRQGFVSRYLDPESRLGEVLFGLIMVLSVTLTASVSAEAGPAGVRQLLWAAIGCNIAWGVIDAVMYLMDTVSRRARDAVLMRKIRQAADRKSAVDMIGRELGERLGGLGTAEQHRTLAAGLLNTLPPDPRRSPIVSRDDVFGALACFFLVFMSCIPAAIPFLIFDEPATAIRASNVILLALLFVVGQRWAAHIGASRLWTGITTLVIGLALVGIAIALGG